MNVSINPSNLKGQVCAPPSKSYAIRSIIVSTLLCKNKIDIYNVGQSQDVMAAINSVKALGATVNIFDDHMKIVPPKRFNDNIIIDVNESATTYRIMSICLMFLGISAKFKMAKSLQKRPYKPVIDLFNKNGLVSDGINFSGKFERDQIKVDPSFSSQIVSGLLIGATAKPTPTRIILTKEPVSVGYIDITIDVLKTFGVNVQRMLDGYFVMPKKSNLTSYTVESDWSHGAMWLVLSNFFDIKINGLNLSSVQGDKKIIEILQSSESVVNCDSTLFVKEKGTKPFVVDGQNIPDLVPILSIFACFLEGKSQILNVNRLAFKESNRLTGIINMLSTFGVKTNYNGSDLEIFGSTQNLERAKNLAVNYQIENDHRMAIALTCLGLISQSCIRFNNGESVQKSYPDFYTHINNLGGLINVEV